MAHKVEKHPILRTRRVASRRYLYFERPPEVWLADAEGEDHTAILGASRRTLPTLAGWITATESGIKVDGFGSGNLNLPSKDPKDVCRLLRSLPGKKQHVSGY